LRTPASRRGCHFAALPRGCATNKLNHNSSPNATGSCQGLRGILGHTGIETSCSARCPEGMFSWRCSRWLSTRSSSSCVRSAVCEEALRIFGRDYLRRLGLRRYLAGARRITQGAGVLRGRHQRVLRRSRFEDSADTWFLHARIKWLHELLVFNNLQRLLPSDAHPYAPAFGTEKVKMLDKVGSCVRSFCSGVLPASVIGLWYPGCLCALVRAPCEAEVRSWLGWGLLGFVPILTLSLRIRHKGVL
jgi:hypothetical protein